MIRFALKWLIFLVVCAYIENRFQIWAKVKPIVDNMVNGYKAST